MREATPDDARVVVEMVADYFEENKNRLPLQRYFKFDDVQTFHYVHTLLGHDDSISFIHDDGVILGELERTWFGPNLVANGILWYVRPRARGGFVAWRLIKAFTEKADSRGAVIALNQLHNAAGKDRIDKLLRLAGYRGYSENYVKEFGPCGALP